ncbi:hypothetical protein [Longispora urticae]
MSTPEHPSVSLEPSARWWSPRSRSGRWLAAVVAIALALAGGLLAVARPWDLQPVTPGSVWDAAGAMRIKISDGPHVTVRARTRIDLSTSPNEPQRYAHRLAKTAWRALQDEPASIEVQLAEAAHPERSTTLKVSRIEARMWFGPRPGELVRLPGTVAALGPAPDARDHAAVAAWWAAAMNQTAHLLGRPTHPVTPTADINNACGLGITALAAVARTTIDVNGTAEAQLPTVVEIWRKMGLLANTATLDSGQNNVSVNPPGMLHMGATAEAVDPRETRQTITLHGGPVCPPTERAPR